MCKDLDCTSAIFDSKCMVVMHMQDSEHVSASSIVPALSCTKQNVQMRLNDVERDLGVVIAASASGEIDCLATLNELSKQRSETAAVLQL